MREDTSTPTTTVIGLDLGSRRSHACVVDRGNGEVLERFEVPTTPDGVRARFLKGAKSTRKNSWTDGEFRPLPGMNALRFKTLKKRWPNEAPLLLSRPMVLPQEKAYL